MSRRDERGRCGACWQRLVLPMALLCGLLAAHGGSAAEGAGDMPISVTRDWPGLKPFDDEVTAFMRARSIPGGALAVSRNGKLILARGYGWADRDSREPVSPHSLFRIASVSKPITAVAVLQLIERSDGRVTLETPAFALLGYPRRPGEEADPRLAGITIRQLLQHTAGRDAAKSFDPMFRPIEIARSVGVKPPAGPEAIIRYMFGQPLDHDPGSVYAYSNFGYCVLGRIIERLSGEGYEQYVKDSVLAPLGIRDMRLGRTLLRDRAPGEVRYYDPGVSDNLMTPEEGDRVPTPYGGFHLEAMDSHGGWIASAADLVRFACAFDDPQHSPLLKPETIATMFARPDGKPGYQPDGRPKAAFYACGWLVRPTSDGRANHWHTGRLAGTSSLLVRRHDGLNWAVLFNQSRDPSGLSYDDIDPALHRAADAVRSWPDDDLFAPGR